MTFHIISIVLLLIVFAVGTFTSINLGAIALVAAFIAGTLLLGEEPKEILTGFPADVFVLILGVTYLFGIAAMNGTLDWLVQRLVRLVRGNAAAVPPLLFLLTSVLVTVGAVAPAVSAIFAKLALNLGRRLGISPVLVGLMVITGGCAGSFSPISLLGAITNSILARNGLTPSPMSLFWTNYVYNLGLAVVAYLIYGGVKLLRNRQVAAPVAVAGGPGAATSALGSPDETVQLNPARIATLVGIVVLAVGMLGFGLDIGMLSLLIAVALHLAFPSVNKGALDRVSWHVIVLICGVVTYVELMDRGGTIDWIGSGVTGIGTPLLVAFLICLIGAVVSAFASSTGVISAMVALAVPFLASGDIAVAGLTAAIAISATVVDSSPFSSTSALIVANTEDQAEQRTVYNGLLRWAAGMVVTAPIVTTLVIVAPGWI